MDHNISNLLDHLASLEARVKSLESTIRFKDSEIERLTKIVNVFQGDYDYCPDCGSPKRIGYCCECGWC